MFALFKRVRSAMSRRRTLTGNVQVGEGFRFGTGSFVWAPRGLEVGLNVSIGSDVRIEADGLIGDSVLIANSAAIVGRHDHEVTNVGIPIRDGKWVGTSPDELSRPTTIGSDVWIGFRATILSGVVVGDCSIVGAASVVTRDVPPNSIVAGNPARIIGERFSPEDLAAHWVKLKAKGIRRVVE